MFAPRSRFSKESEALPPQRVPDTNPCRRAATCTSIVASSPKVQQEARSLCLVDKSEPNHALIIPSLVPFARVSKPVKMRYRVSAFRMLTLAAASERATTSNSIAIFTR